MKFFSKNNATVTDNALILSSDGKQVLLNKQNCNRDKRDPSHPLNTTINPHHHIHRHRHVHHHRNYEGHVHLQTTLDNDDNLNDESVDDPGSMVHPSSSSCCLSHSSDKNNNANITLMQGANGNIQLETIDINVIEAQNNNDDDIELKLNRNALSCLNATGASVTRNGSTRSINLISTSNLHRSTPNLSILDGDNYDDGETEEAVAAGLTSNKSNASIDYSHSNLVKLKANFPSNLELSTDLSDLENQISPLLLNNEIAHHFIQTEKLNRINLNSKLNILNNLNKIESASSYKSKTLANNSNNNVIINNNNSNCIKKNFQRYKLIVEGDVHICKLPNSRNYISKILNSKLLRRWKTHRLILTDTEMFSAAVS